MIEADGWETVYYSPPRPLAHLCGLRCLANGCAVSGIRPPSLCRFCNGAGGHRVPCAGCQVAGPVVKPVIR